MYSAKKKPVVNRYQIYNTKRRDDGGDRFGYMRTARNNERNDDDLRETRETPRKNSQSPQDVYDPDENVNVPTDLTMIA